MDYIVLNKSIDINIKYMVIYFVYFDWVYLINDYIDVSGTRYLFLSRLDVATL